MNATQVHKGAYSQIASAGKLRQRLCEEGYSVSSWQDVPGQYYAAHSHTHDEFIVISSGSMIFTIDSSQRYELRAGDALSLPANTLHEAVNENSQPVTYFICTRTR